MHIIFVIIEKKHKNRQNKDQLVQTTFSNQIRFIYFALYNLKTPQSAAEQIKNTTLHRLLCNYTVINQNNYYTFDHLIFSSVA